MRSYLCKTGWPERYCDENFRKLIPRNDFNCLLFPCPVCCSCTDKISRLVSQADNKAGLNTVSFLPGLISPLVLPEVPGELVLAHHPDSEDGHVSVSEGTTQVTAWLTAS